MYCNYEHGRCTAPDTECIHWMGTFCEMDATVIVRDCHKSVYETECHDNPVGCVSYKRDAQDGDYYG